MERPIGPFPHPPRHFQSGPLPRNPRQRNHEDLGYLQVQRQNLLNQGAWRFFRLELWDLPVCGWYGTADEQKPHAGSEERSHPQEMAAKQMFPLTTAAP